MEHVVLGMDARGHQYEPDWVDVCVRPKQPFGGSDPEVPGGIQKQGEDDKQIRASESGLPPVDSSATRIGINPHDVARCRPCPKGVAAPEGKTKDARVPDAWSRGDWEGDWLAAVGKYFDAGVRGDPQAAPAVTLNGPNLVRVKSFGVR